MIDERCGPELAERARALDLDWRGAWVGPAAGAFAAHPDPVARDLGVRALEPVGEASLDTVLEPLRRRPAHAAEMVSEVRAGERITRLLREGAWWLVAVEDGYVGWIHEWVLREDRAAPPEAVAARYARPAGTLWVSDHWAAGPLWLGMPLWEVDAPVRERGGRRLLRAAWGGEGWVEESELAPPEARCTARESLADAFALLGTPYRWGGRSPAGFDCSGLVQYVAGLAGAALPRDAAQQERVGEAVAPDRAHWEAGDLLFFGTPADHVGFHDGRGGLVHCRGRVRRDALGDIPQLVERLGAVRRWWGLRGARPASPWVAPLGERDSA